MKNFLARAAQAYAYLGQPGAPRVVLSVSGGKDSGALYLFLCYLDEKYGFEFEVVFADTGNEHPITLAYIHDLPRLAGGGPKVVTVRADFAGRIAKRREYVAANYEPELAAAILLHLKPSGNPFLDLCLWKGGKFPSTTRRFCTSELKVIPVREYHEELVDRGYVVESWQGVRAEESPERARLPKRQLEDVGIWNVRPALRWKVQRHILPIHHYFGVPLNPLYTQGCGRVGCMPCINSRKEEIYQISERWPEVIARIAAWERAVSLVSKRRGSTFFYKGGMSEEVKSDPLLVANESGIRGIIRWAKTSRGGRQYDMMKMQPVPACQVNTGFANKRRSPRRWQHRRLLETDVFVCRS